MEPAPQPISTVDLVSVQRHPSPILPKQPWNQAGDWWERGEVQVAAVMVVVVVVLAAWSRYPGTRDAWRLFSSLQPVAGTVVATRIVSADDSEHRDWSSLEVAVRISADTTGEDLTAVSFPRLPQRHRLGNGRSL